MNYARISKVSALSVAIFSALALPAFAADNTADSSVKTKDVIVTATRTEEEVKNVPQAVEVITKDDIEKLGATDVYQALKLASNINVSTAGMAGHNVMIRGMSTNHSLVLINGLRQAGEDTAQTQNVYALNRISLSDIERIEIVRGPASAQYGSDALGGVINIITKKSADSKGSVMAGISTGTESINNYYFVDFGKHGNFDGNVDLRFSKWRKNVSEGSGNSNYYGPVQDFHFNGNLDLGNNQNLNLNLGYYKENTSADYADTKTKSGAYFTKKDTKEWYNYKRFDASLAWTGKDDRNDWMIRPFYSQLKKENRQYNNRPTFPVVTMPKLNENGKPVMQNGRPVFVTTDMEQILGALYPKYDWDTSKYTLWGIEGKNSVAVNDEHLVTYGAEYRSNKVEGTRLGGGGDNRRPVSSTGNGVTIDKTYSEKTLTSYAAYIQDEWMIGDKLLIIPSLRFDHDSNFGNETTPKIGATYFINPHQRFKVSWGKGFKAPTVSELYMQMNRSMGEGIVHTINNPNLQPEETNSWDISYEIDSDKSWGKATYFHNDVKNLITSLPVAGLNDPDKGMYYYRNVNIDRAKINGVELELGHKLSDEFTVKVTSNWLDATDKSDGSRLPDRAKNVSTVQLSYDDNDDYGYSGVLWYQFNHKYHYQSGTDANRNPIYDDTSFGTLNFSVNKKFGKGNRVFAGLDNIFDKKNYDVFLDGRTWVAGAEWTF